MLSARRLHALYRYDGRLFKWTPAYEHKLIGHLYYRGAGRVVYDADGLEAGCVPSRAFVEWLRKQRGKF